MSLSSHYGLSQPFLAGMVTSAVGFVISLKATDMVLMKYPLLKDKVDNKLTAKARKFFFCLGPSTLHSFVQVFGTMGYLHRLYYSPDGVLSFDDRLWVEYGLTKIGPSFYGGIFVGYLITDIIFCGFQNLGIEYTVHHLTASLTWTVAEYYNIMQFLCSFLQFNEASTIFMNLRQLYLTIGFTSKDKEVMTVSYTFFFVFFLVRVLPLPFIIKDWAIGGDFTTIRDAVGMPVAGWFSLACLCHTGLQSGWFLMMLKKVLSSSSSSSSKKAGKQETTGKVDKK